MQAFLPPKVTEFFLENPFEEVYLRQLARILHLSPFATKKYADVLVKADLVSEERKANVRSFKANVNNQFYRHLKIAYGIRQLLKSGLIDAIKEQGSAVSSITLFGSMAKGEDTKTSDVDLMVIGHVKKEFLINAEQKLGKTINIHNMSWAEWNKEAGSNAPFYFEVIQHGIPLQGELPIIKWK